jgi:hypothetical protein
MNKLYLFFLFLFLFKCELCFVLKLLTSSAYTFSFGLFLEIVPKAYNHHVVSLISTKAYQNPIFLYFGRLPINPTYSCMAYILGFPHLEIA